MFKPSVLAVATTALFATASTLSIGWRQNVDTLCVGQPDFLRIPYDSSCVLYFQCYVDRAYLMQCPDDAWFNEIDQICDRSEPPVECNIDETDPEEPEPEPGPEEPEPEPEEPDPEEPETEEPDPEEPETEEPELEEPEPEETDPDDPEPEENEPEEQEPEEQEPEETEPEEVEPEEEDQEESEPEEVNPEEPEAVETAPLEPEEGNLVVVTDGPDEEENPEGNNDLDQGERNTGGGNAFWNFFKFGRI